MDIDEIFILIEPQQFDNMLVFQFLHHIQLMPQQFQVLWSKCQPNLFYRENLSSLAVHCLENLPK
jgi:hypothetical protein